MLDEDRARVAEEIGRLARWAAATQLADIPHPVLQRAIRILADDLGAMIGARDEPEVAQFHRQVIERARCREATVFRGGRDRTDRISAAVANATAADWLELDEGFRPTPCHAGLYVLPALLAEAESSGLAFGDVLRALVLGYEVVTRVARGWTVESVKMQSHGRYGAVGAAAAVGLASRLEPGLLVQALGTAVTLVSPAPRNHLAEGLLARNVWPAAGAWSGMMAVQWAGCGIGGAAGGFFDVYSTVLGGRARPEALTDGLGEDWAVMQGYTKIHACCQHLHAAVEACLLLRSRELQGVSPQEIAEVRVDTHVLALPLSNAQPSTTLGAKFSLPHAVAAALVLGTGGATAFDAASMNVPDIQALRERVRITPYDPVPDPPDDRPARVAVTLRSGRTLVRECLSAEGGPDRPFADTVVFDKLRALAAPIYPRIVPAFESFMRLEPSTLARGWIDVVDEICASTPAAAERTAKTRIADH